MRELSVIQIKFSALIVHGLSDIAKSTIKRALPDYCLTFKNYVEDIRFELIETKFDLIIADAKSSVTQLLTLINASNSKNANSPLLALTNEVEHGELKKLINSGFDDYLAKPLTVEKLTEAFKIWQKNDDLTPIFRQIDNLLGKQANDISVTTLLYRKLFEELPVLTEKLGLELENNEIKQADETAHCLKGIAKYCYLEEIQESLEALQLCLSINNKQFAEGYLLMLKERVNKLLGYQDKILNYLYNLNPL